MTITELYNQLCDKGFQNHETGNLFFPAYMYMYNPEQEYEIEKEILDIKNRLHRPNNYLDVMVLDIFEEFVVFLKNEKFGNSTKYKYYLEHESNKKEAVDKALKQDAYSEKFLINLRDKIASHQNNTDYEVAYVFIKGFGNSYPYLRASRFMSNFEKYIKGYKLIMFYPGVAKGYYSLFGILQDENLYRAIKLINE
ncbi:BREX protein BrxB domain-containing protein [Aquirufa sp. ROCK2-A2]